MKISDTIKSAPWEGIVEAGLGGLGSLVSGLTQIGAAKRQHKYNMQEMEQEQKYALEQMQQSQEYNLANMAQQNQYQIDAEKRAQEWNHVGAQIARGQSAGVSALATLGAGSSQSMGVSSAPSSSTPSPAGAPSSKGVSKPGMNFDTSSLGKLVQQGRMVSAEIEGIEAENALKEAQKKNVEEDTKLKQQQHASVEWYNENKRELEKEMLKNGVEESKAKAITAKVTAAYETWKNTPIDDEGYSPAQEAFLAAIAEAKALTGKYEAEEGQAVSQTNLNNVSAEDLEETRKSRIDNNTSLANYYDSLHLTNDAKREYDVEYSRLNAQEKQIANDFMSWHNGEIKAGRDPRPTFQKVMDITDRANALLDTYLDYKVAKDKNQTERDKNRQSDINNRRSTLAQFLVPLIKILFAKSK